MFWNSFLFPYLVTFITYYTHDCGNSSERSLSCYCSGDTGQRLVRVETYVVEPVSCQYFYNVS